MKAVLCALFLAAGFRAPLPASAEEPSLYELGTAARERGDHEAAKEAFAKMLAKDPKSGGALEGIALACLSLEQYDEAYGYLWRWNLQKPDNPYIHDLLARAAAGMNRRRSKKAPPEPAAKPVEPPASKAVEEPSLYEAGWTARRGKDYRGSKELFAKMLEKDPASKGALEGLSLDCLSLDEYPEAVRYLEQWRRLSPDSAYVLGLLSRAQRNLGDDEGALESTVALAEAEPKNIDPRHKIESMTTDSMPGVFPQGRIRKSLSSEGLGTTSPQRIVYEGRSGGARARVKATPTINLTGGADFIEDAQRNDTRGFIYYDILEHIYSFGLEYKPKKDLFFSGEYGQDVVDNVHGAGLPGRTEFSKAKLVARARFLSTDWSAEASRTPYFNRGAGGNNFFALLRDAGAKIQAETELPGFTLRGRAGVDAISEGTTLKTWSVLATEESGSDLIAPSYSHGEQDFYGSAPDGRLGYVLTDRYGGRVRRLVEEQYQLSASGGYTTYADGNRLTDASVGATGWLPWFKELSGSYRFDSLGYKVDSGNYSSVTQFYQWLGAYWKHPFGHGLWTTLGYEHGLLWDVVRYHYDGNAWLAELEWYHGRDLSLKAQGRVGVDTVRDQSVSGGLQARYSFR